MSNGVRRVLLDGNDWSFAMRDSPKPKKNTSPVSQLPDLNSFSWMPAKVPGNVHLDLLANGKIPDPYYGRQILNSRWVEGKEWWYRKEFALALQSGERAQLIFKGLDYIADVWVNGHYAGQHIGMFSHWVIDITPWCSGERVSLVLCFASPSTYGKNRFSKARMQMTYGWDIAPRVITAGIWDSVEIKVYSQVRIAHNSVFVKLDPDVERSDANAAILIEGRIIDPSNAIAPTRPASVRVDITGKNFECKPLWITHPVAQAGKFSFRISITDPHYWMPWDQGTPQLYTVRIIVQIDGAECDAEELIFGLREINRIFNPSKQVKDLPWTFTINGESTYLRGANWVPADIFPGKLSQETYAKYLNAAKEMGLNFLRVWGGGLREKDAFYDLADEMGILIWQEFPVACVTYPFLPSDRSFLKLMGREAVSIVKTLRNHPSLVEWCGANEVAINGNTHVLDTFGRAVALADGTRPWQRTSPMEGQGERHNYEVWHGYAPLTAYLEDMSAFPSEFGMSGFPSIESLKDFLPPKERRLFSKTFLFHNPQMVPFYPVTTRHERYALPHLTRFPPTLEDFAIATQKSQALALQTAIEHYRRRKPVTSGVVFWQLDESWPAPGFAPIDYYFRKKLAFDVLKRCMAPVLVSADIPPGTPIPPGQSYDLNITIVNDFPQSITDLTVRGSLDGLEVFRQENFALAGHSTTHLMPIQVQVPAGRPPNVLSLQLESADGAPVATSEYPLGYKDPFDAPLVRSIMGRLHRWQSAAFLTPGHTILNSFFPALLQTICMYLATAYVYFKWKGAMRRKHI